MAKVPKGVETLQKILTGWVWCTVVTNTRQADERQHIANVNASSRSLKRKKERNITVANWVFAPTIHVVRSKLNFAWG